MICSLHSLRLAARSNQPFHLLVSPFWSMFSHGPQLLVSPWPAHKGDHLSLGPPVVRFCLFFEEGSPTKIDHRKKEEKKQVYPYFSLSAEDPALYFWVLKGQLGTSMESPVTSHPLLARVTAGWFGSYWHPHRPLRLAAQLFFSPAYGSCCETDVFLVCLKTSIWLRKLPFG